MRPGFIGVLLWACASVVNALEIADVKLQEQVKLEGTDKALSLNGAGIRYKFIFKIYVGALYLEEKNTDASSILSNTPANRILMHFIYSEVPKEKLVNAWLEGFKNNNPAELFTAVESRLARFNEMFSTLKENDVVLLDYIPGKGTRVNIKGNTLGVIEGEDFNRALLAVWLGNEPVTEELKRSMLGLQEED